METMKTARNTNACRHLLFVAILAVSVGPNAWAQSGSRNPIGGGSAGGTGGGSIGGGSTIDGSGTVGFGGGLSGASTPASANLHGIADALRARGDAQRSASEAAINVQTARGKAIKNRVDSANAVVAIRKARFDADRLKREYAAEVREERKARLTALRSRPKRIPKTLSPYELDHYSGKIAWPVTLRDQQFSQVRKAVEKELTLHVRQTGSNEARLLTSISTLRKSVGKQARTIGYREFAAASKFLDRLRNHIRYSDQLMKHREMLAKM